MNTKTAAAFLNVTVGTLSTYRWAKYGPGYLKKSGRILYPLDELEAWRARQRRGNGHAK